ncbi:hypothetical protein [Janthinobacterium sp. AD80]|uniref:hypothetical protein n=1 Tax=Janthinobacterium sp. AD80 TaxID=1528773 RepID=UPI000C81B9BC|nr:hypothetical protein [Janthinobacterium sp. AD80]PMQ16375.1 hypothetical protein JaAD80_10975 [Janthinobacterium sp. AD80]
MHQRTFFVSRGAPYYIAAPSYTEHSAGIVVLHLLCHALNVSGQEAYLVIDTLQRNRKSKTRAGLATPLLTKKILLSHQRQGRQPVAIYPEVEQGNPFHASKVVRYYLNKPGFFDGVAALRDGEFNLAYSSAMLEGFAVPDHILYLPLINTELFHESGHRTPGKSCFYLGRHRTAKASSPLINDDSVEITLSYPDNKEELAELFRSCEYFISYQFSSLCIEATLCGCIAIVIPNDNAPSALVKTETQMHGIAWGAEPAEIARARETLPLARALYLEKQAQFWNNLDIFIEKTQHFEASDARIDPSRYFGWRKFGRRLAAFVQRKWKGQK